MIDLREQWAQYLSAAELDKKRKLTPTEIEKLKNECYKQKLKTSFDHRVYNDGWWNTASTTLDFIPIVGGIKGFIEGCVGKTMSGEKLTANEQTQYKLMGVVSFGLDVFTLGTATAAIQGVKTGSKLVSAMGKFVLTDVAVGWGTKFTSEAMFNIGMPPQLVFAIHIGANLVVGKHNTKVKNVNNMKDLETTLGLKPEQIQDLMKHTGKNLDDFAKVVKNGELDSLLGIPEMNMKYLMKQTGKNADEIADWLKRNDIDLKDIKPKNVDDIIKRASGADRTIDDLIKQTGLISNQLGDIMKYTGKNADELLGSLKKGDLLDIIQGRNIDFIEVNINKYDEFILKGLKPSNSPTLESWKRMNGKIEINADGSLWKYTDVDGNSVYYRDGFPDFYQYKYPDIAPVTIEISKPKNNPADFRAANEAAGLGPNTNPPVTNMSRPPEGYTWHHMEDGKTMILINSDIHADFKHIGGQSLINGKGGK